MNVQASIILIAACIMIQVISLQAKSESKPSWLDTIPPKIVLQPEKKVHDKVFSMTLTSNEQGLTWYKVGATEQFRQYKRPVSFMRDGVYPIYFYAEDDFGNKTPMDSTTYTLDTKAPKFTVIPPPGVFKTPVYLHVESDEKCTWYFIKNGRDSTGIKFTDSLLIKSPMLFKIVAVDLAGNKSFSEEMKYTIDTTSLKVAIDPQGGIYNRIVFVTFKFNPDITVWYTFDPLASSRWFTKYESQVALPHGLSSIRYFAKSQSGIESEIFNTRFIVDTIPPKLIKRIANGNRFDTLLFSSRERATIYFTKNGTIPTIESERYSTPLIIPKSGIQRIKARAWDEAGNSSEIVEWEYRYDYTPPELEVLTQSGTFRAPFTLYMKTDEPARILYSLDNSKVNKNSLLYSSTGIFITRDDTTILRAVAIDSAGNSSREFIGRYFLDTKPPIVKVRIDGKLQSGIFTVSLSANEPSQIYYEIGGREPTSSSQIYRDELSMSTGQVLKYFAIDKSGNISATGTMDELRKPMVEANPSGGVYNRKLSISFSTNVSGVIYWRLLPDTSFSAAKDVVSLEREGQHTFEYFLETEGGQRGSIHRREYMLDWTPPVIEVRTRKGTNDSAIVFLRSNERATYYYTTDGTNPLVSSTTGTAGNKFLQNSDRLVLKRSSNLKLAIYAQDAAGNQSALSVLDIFSPRAIPDIPAGANRMYDKVLSVTFNSYDDAVIYYTKDNTVPTRMSEIFSRSLTLLASDTIMTMVTDASGFAGIVDTFVYMIDLPPIPLFTTSPDTIFEGDAVLFNASASFDKEYDASTLTFRWDFDGDGKYDTDTLTDNTVSYRYEKAGYYKTKLTVFDKNNHPSSIDNVCIVKERCPDDMISIINEDGSRFCVDMYEWPNIRKTVPQTGVSWVEAKMSCIDAGKRLCTAQEWERACQGHSSLVYPYGDTYQKERCPVEVKKIQKSGAFTECQATGAFDMLGNAWEWVEDKQGDYPLSYGGSFRYGKLSRCNLKSEGNVSSQSSETGFRCCK